MGSPEEGHSLGEQNGFSQSRLGEIIGWEIDPINQEAFLESDFFVRPAMTTDTLTYMEVREGETPEDALRRHFELPPKEIEAAP